MFLRNKRPQNKSTVTPPIDTLPKEPVLREMPMAGSGDFMDGHAPLKSLEAASGASAREMPDSHMSSKLEVVGNIKSTGGLSLNGQVKGDVQAADLELGPEAHVRGTVRAQRISVFGTVEGAIFANDVKLKQSARVDGDIEHRTLSIESGAEFNGAVRRSDSPVEGVFDESDEDKRDSKKATPSPAIELQSSDKVDVDEKITSVLSAEEVAFNGSAKAKKTAEAKPVSQVKSLPGRKF